MNILYCWLSSQADSSVPPGPALSVSGIIVAPDSTAIESTANFWALIPITYGMTQADLETAIIAELASGYGYTDPVGFVFLPQF